MVLAASAAGAANAPADSTQTVYLQPQELGTRIKGYQLDITPQTFPFWKEPALGERTVCRGTINSAFMGARPSGAAIIHTIRLPFLWDYTQGRLYLDLNRNGDLTAAPAYSTKIDSGNYFYQTFTNIQVTFKAETPSHRVLVDIALYGHAGKNNPGGNLTWRSFWQGKVLSSGREWQVGLIENPNHLGSTTDAYLLLRPWMDREKSFSLDDGSLAGFAYPPQLFFNGQAYQLSCDYLPGDPPRYQLGLSATRPELGEVALTGQFIKRMVFNRHQSKTPFTVVLDQPGPSMKIPVGTYNKHWIVLKENDTEAFYYYSDWLRDNPVTIKAGQVNLLNVGGPLTNSVSVMNRGRVLSLDYQLVGADAHYRLALVDRTKPPQWTIFQGGKQIASGQFAFG